MIEVVADQESLQQRIAELTQELQATKDAVERDRQLGAKGAPAAWDALQSLGTGKEARAGFGALFEMFKKEMGLDDARAVPSDREDELADQIVRALDLHKRCLLSPARRVQPGDRGGVWHGPKRRSISDDSLRGLLAAAFELKAAGHRLAYDAVVEWCESLITETTHARTAVAAEPEREAVTVILRDALSAGPGRRNGDVTQALRTVAAGSPALLSKGGFEDLVAVLEASLFSQGMVGRASHRLASERGRRFEPVNLLRQATAALADDSSQPHHQKLVAFMNAMTKVADLQELRGLGDSGLRGVAEALRAPQLTAAVDGATAGADAGGVYRAFVTGLRKAKEKGASAEALASVLALTLGHNKHVRRNDLLGAAYEVFVAEARNPEDGVRAFQRFAQRAVKAGLIDNPRHGEEGNAQRRAVMAAIRAARSVRSEPDKLEALRKLYTAVAKSGDERVIDKHVLRGAFWKADKYDTAWLYAHALRSLVPRPATEFARYDARLRTLADHKLELRRGQVGDDLPRWGWRPARGDKATFEKIDDLLRRMQSDGHEGIAEALGSELKRIAEAQRPDVGGMEADIKAANAALDTLAGVGALTRNDFTDNVWKDAARHMEDDFGHELMALGAFKVADECLNAFREGHRAKGAALAGLNVLQLGAVIPLIPVTGLGGLAWDAASALGVADFPPRRVVLAHLKRQKTEELAKAAADKLDRLVDALNRLDPDDPKKQDLKKSTIQVAERLSQALGSSKFRRTPQILDTKLWVDAMLRPA